MFDLMTGFAVAFPSLMGSRLMLNVRRAYYKPLMRTVGSPSDIELAHIPDTTIQVVELLKDDVRGETPDLLPPHEMVDATRTANLESAWS